MPPRRRGKAAAAAAAADDEGDANMAPAPASASAANAAEKESAEFLADEKARGRGDAAGGDSNASVNTSGISTGKGGGGNGNRKVADEKEVRKTLAKDFLKDVTNKDDLLRRLRKLSSVLIDLQQDGPWGDAVRKGVATELARADMLRHKSNDVRLQVACCLADVLRLTAPEAPYDETQLKTIFELFIAQLRGVTRSASPDLPKYFHLLESLAVIKTCLIIVDFESDDTLVKLFTNFFEMSKEEPNTITLFHMMDILASCVEETKEISARFLDVVLRNICPPVDPHAYRMAQQLITRCHAALEKPIHRFIRNVLPQKSDAAKNDDEEVSGITERKNQLHVIFELCLWCPQILTSIVPLFQDALECEDKAERSSFVNLFGRVFVHEKSSLDSAFPPLYTAWIRRLHDNEPDIRIRMAECMEELLSRRAPTTEIITELQQRSQDPNDKVRARVVQAICKAMEHHAHAVAPDLIASVTERLLDKKPVVRREAQMGLAKCFKQHCAESWKRGEASEMGKRFSFSPRKILTQYVKTSVHTDQLFDEEFLDLGYTLAERTRTFIGINAALDDRGRDSLRTMLHDKAVAQQSLRDILKFKRAALNASDAQEQALNDKRKMEMVTILARSLPFDKTKDDTPAAQAAAPAVQAQVEHLKALIDHKDKNVHKLLDKLIDPETEYKSLRDVKHELIKAVGSNKGALTDFVKRLCTRAANVLMPIDALKVLFEQIHFNLNAKRAKLVESAMNVLLFVASSFPRMLRHAAPELQKLFASGDGVVLPVALEVLSLIDLDITKPVAHDLLRVLIELLPKCRAAHIKHLISSVLHLEKRSDSDTFGRRAVEMQSFLGEHLNETDTQLPVALEGYTALAKLALSKFEGLQDDAKVLQFVQQKLLPLNPLATAPTKRKAPLPPDVLLAAKVAGVGLLSQYLMSIADRELEALKKAAVDAANQSASKVVAAGQRGKLVEAAGKFDDKEADAPAHILTTLFAVVKEDGDLTGELKAVKESGGLLKADEAAAKKGKGKKKAAAAEDGDAEDEKAPDPGGAAGKTLELIEKHEAELVLSAAKGLLSLCGKPQYPAVIWCEHGDRMINLAMVMHHHQAVVRQRFADFVLQELKDARLPFQFSILLSLTASEPVVGELDMPKRMRAHLPQLMTRQRLLIDLHRQLYKNRADMPEHLRSPEFLLADLIHLLAHHSDFVDPLVPRVKPVRSNSLVRQDSAPAAQPDVKERELTDAERTSQRETFEYFQMFVSMFLDALLPKNVEHDYKLLMNILVQIKKCEISGASADTATALNHNMYCLAEIAQLLLEKRAQDDTWNDNYHQQDIRLPPRLFRPLKETESRNVRTRYLPQWYADALAAAGVKGGGRRGAGASSTALSTPSKATPKKAAATPSSGSKRKRGAAAADDESGGTPSRRGKKSAAAAADGDDGDDAEDTPSRAKRAKKTPTPASASTRKLPERKVRGTPTQLSFAMGDGASDDEAFERMLDSHEQEKIDAKQQQQPKPQPKPKANGVAAAAAAASSPVKPPPKASPSKPSPAKASPVKAAPKNSSAKPATAASAANGDADEPMRDDAENGDGDEETSKAKAKKSPVKAQGKVKGKGKAKGKRRGGKAAAAAAAAAAAEVDDADADADAGAAAADADGDAEMGDAAPAAAAKPAAAAAAAAAPKPKFGKRK